MTVLDAVRNYRRRAEKSQEAETIKLGDIELKVSKGKLLLAEVVEASMAMHPWPPKKQHNDAADSAIESIVPPKVDPHAARRF
jgi:hypothetical protein